MLRPLRYRRILYPISFIVLLVAVTLSAWPHLAQAAEITVDTNLDFTVTTNSNCTLPEAILAANLNAAQDDCPSGDDSAVDTIVLAVDTTYVMTTSFANYDGDTGLPSITSTVVISGNDATLSRDSVDLFRLIHITETVGNLTITDLTLTNGHLDGPVVINTDHVGGAIANFGTLRLLNSRVISNTADLGGGGIATIGGNTTISNSQIVTNFAPAGAGVVNIFNGTLAVVESEISFNIASEYGGGLLNTLASTATITDSDLYSNSVSDTGGGFGAGLYNTAGSDMTVTNSRVSRNWAFDGGGIYVEASTMQIIDSQVYSNGASSGGGLLLTANSTTWITNTLVYSNTADQGGAGALVNNSRVSLVDSEFTHNVALNSGGAAIFGASGARIRLVDTLVKANRSFGNDPFDGNGGAIATNSASIVLISGSDIVENQAHGEGGALTHLASFVVITDTRILSNTAGRDGGAIYNDTNTILRITNSDLYSNTATTNGGAIYNTAALTLTAVTLRANEAMTNGGALYQANGSYFITDTLLLANRAGENGGAVAHGGGVGNIVQSCIVDNSALAYSHPGGSDVEAENNWWGAPDGPSGVGPGSGDGVDDDVDFTPFFTSPLADCPSRTVALGFEKRATPAGNLVPGQPLTYTLTITNAGETDIYELLVSDLLPAGFQLTTEFTAGATFNSEGDGYRVPILGAGETGTVTYVGNVSPDITSGQTLTNTGILSHAVAGLLTATVSNNVVLSGLAFTVIANAPEVHLGETVTYTYRLTNTGSAQLTTISAVDATLGDVPELENALAPAATAVATRTHVVTNDDLPGPMVKVVTVSASDEFDNTITRTVTVTVAIVGEPGLALSVFASAPEARIGDVITYTYRLTNTGSLLITDIIITDTAFNQSFAVDELAPNAGVTRGYSRFVIQNDLPGPIVNQVEAKGSYSQDETVSASGSASVTILRFFTSLPRLSRQEANE